MIRSGQNRLLKLAAALRTPRTRRGTGLVLLEGRKAIADALAAGAAVAWALVAEGFRGEPLRALERARVPVHEVAAAAFAKVAATETAQGIAAAVREPRAEVERVLGAPGEAPLAVLDRIQDPGNLGTMLRTAAALGFRGAILLPGTADPFAPKTVRASAGTVLRFPVLEAEDPAAALAGVKAAGFEVLAAAEGGRPPAPERGRVALVVGNEGQGIAPGVLAAADRRVWIPIAAGVESLNAAAAFAILAYAIRRESPLRPPADILESPSPAR
jgi:TrmH family RNA methyltransferase